MLTTLDLLAAAKRGAGIPSNYRLARKLDITDSAVQRWNTGRGVPDDANAAELAVMAGLDVEYVVASMRAAREKDPTLKAIFVRTAERLLLTATGPTAGPMPPPESGSDEDDDDGPGPGGLIGGIGAALASPTDEQPGLCVMLTNGCKEKAPHDSLHRHRV